MLWDRRYSPYSGFGVHEPAALAIDNSGNVVVTGHSQIGRRDDYYTAKYAAATSALLWEKLSENVDWEGRSSDTAIAVMLDGSGNAIVTGTSRGDYYTLKYAGANGGLLWQKRYSGSANDFDHAAALAVDGNGNVIVTGTSYRGTSDDYYTAKYAASNGALLWEKRYNGPAGGNDQSAAVTVDATGNVVVTGTSAVALNGDYYTAKYAAGNGALQWEKRYDGSTNQRDQMAAVAVDANGNVILTGYSSSGTNDDYYTAKYARITGALLWENRYNGPTDGDDQALAVTVDRHGDVVVTGSSPSGYYTVKYAGTDGARLWENRSTGGGTAVAVDASGNVVVSGYAGDSDYYTAKYAAEDGALLWDRQYSGQAGGFDSITALAVDSSGNVILHRGVRRRRRHSALGETLR